MAAIAFWGVTFLFCAERHWTRWSGSSQSVPRVLDSGNVHHMVLASTDQTKVSDLGSARCGNVQPRWVILKSTH
jgi:hypothetical protein